LKDFLSQRLPDHMVPAAFVPLEKLPLTPNGKVDRKALPAPDYQAAAASAGYEPARDPVEETLVEIWQEVLSADRVGVHDNFFDLGGHSLLAAQVVARIHRTFDLEIPLRTLFEFPTIAGLAAQITTLKEASGAGDDDLLEQLLGELENLTDEQVEQIKTAKFKSQE
jgi:acyl carrier protein